jgi:hypothetical protein
MRPKSVLRTLRICFAAGTAVLLVSSPGVGKTDLVKQAANEAAIEYLIGHPVVSDPTDFKGMPYVMLGKNEAGTEAVFLPFSDLKKLIKAKKPLVYFLDDLGQASPTVQAACMQLVLARRIGEHKVSDHVVFIAATNRKQDRAAVSGVIEPLKSRFLTIINVETHVDDWSEWAAVNSMPAELIAFINLRPELLNKFEPSAEITNSPCPRTIAHVGKCMGMGFAKEDQQEIYAGAAGEGFASELWGFLDVYKDLPNPDKCLQDPRSVKLPTGNPAAMYALCGAVAYRVADKPKLMEKLIKLGEQMNDEYSTLAVMMATKKNDECKNTRAYAKWISDHREMLG